MRRKSAPSRTTAHSTKTINLALQGGGAHGAFAWGVLDRLLEDGRLDFEGIFGTSAGSMNAAVLVHGMIHGGRDGARAALARFWQAISEAGQRYSLVRTMPWDRLKRDYWNNDSSLSFQTFKAMMNTFSPAQLNPMNFNPLRDILNEQVDFAQINQHKDHKLFLSATNVQTGNVRVFQNHPRCRGVTGPRTGTCRDVRRVMEQTGYCVAGAMRAPAPRCGTPAQPKTGRRALDAERSVDRISAAWRGATVDRTLTYF